MVGKAITSIENSRLFPTALLEWNGYKAANKDWANLKAHYSKAYTLLITTGPEGTRLNMAVTVRTTKEDFQDENDSSLTTLTNTLGKMAMANNASNQAVKEDI